MTAKKLRVIDLFSGLGGFSQAFLDRGHDVTRYDNDKKFADVPNTIVADVREIEPSDIAGADIILASPPCNCFSTMTIRYYWPNGQPDKRARAAIKLVKDTIRLIDEAKPRYWVLENPNGMLVRVLGRPPIRTWWAAWGTSYLKPTNLWGILPSIEWPSKPKDGYVKVGRTAGYRQVGIQGMKDSAEAALVPYKFSEALCESLEKDLGGQLSIQEFIG
jgi:hypothetical protein